MKQHLHRLSALSDEAFDRVHLEFMMAAFHGVAVGFEDIDETLDLFDEEYVRRFGPATFVDPEELEARVHRVSATN